MMTRRQAIATIGTIVVATRAWAADETTLKGEIVCARCYLNKPDAKECQDVLLVKDPKGTTDYYIAKNKVSQDAGEACTNVIPATIVGNVSEKAGRKWITASKITKH